VDARATTQPCHLIRPPGRLTPPRLPPHAAGEVEREPGVGIVEVDTQPFGDPPDEIGDRVVVLVQASARLANNVTVKHEIIRAVE
jgi:hypothetical protein